MAGIIDTQKTGAPPQKWTYIGTSSAYDGTYSLGPTSTTVTTTCRTTTTIINTMNTTRPPDNYALGYRMRVTHQRNECTQFGCSAVSCTTYYFRVDLL